MLRVFGRMFFVLFNISIMIEFIHMTHFPKKKKEKKQNKKEPDEEQEKREKYLIKEVEYDYLNI